MKVTKEEVKIIADISRITVSENEIEALKSRLEAVLSYAACVQKIAGEIEDQPSNKNINFLREDVVTKSKSEKILEQAPEREGDYFIVPKILDKK